jgi:pyruvate dehydrogenase E1 component alpha subunit
MKMEKVSVKKTNSVKLPKEQYLKWYESMLLMRRFEERAQQMYLQQKIRGFCHIYIGQEAVAAGSVSAIRPEDNIITAYRDHAHPLAKGMEPKYVMAELFAKATGCSKGKGGSMHIFDVKHKFFGGHGIVGGQIPLGAGLAFADQYRKSDLVTLCMMGDGAVRQGAFHEALNMAMLWKLPVIFIIENNGYAMGTSVERTSNVTELYELGRAFNMPSFPVDGMKCETVHEAISSAAENARKGKGPTLLEVKTYRYRGHSMSDPATYRTKEEVESYKAQDPIEHTLDILKKNKWITDADIEAMEKKIKDQVDEAVKFADESPYPDASELYKDVYMQGDYPFIMD